MVRVIAAVFGLQLSSKLRLAVAHCAAKTDVLTHLLNLVRSDLGLVESKDGDNIAVDDVDDDHGDDDDDDDDNQDRGYDDDHRELWRKVRSEKKRRRCGEMGWWRSSRQL